MIKSNLVDLLDLKVICPMSKKNMIIKFKKNRDDVNKKNLPTQLLVWFKFKVKQLSQYNSIDLVYLKATD